MAHTSIPDSHRDLLDGDFATLATVGEDGFPQVSEVWFLAEADQVAMSHNTARQKVKNLEAEPACTLLLLDLRNPYRYAPGDRRVVVRIVPVRVNAVNMGG